MEFRFLPAIFVGSCAGRALRVMSFPTRGFPTLTLRAKAILALAAMIAYVMVFALYVAQDQRRLLDIVGDQKAAYDRQQAVIRVNAAVAHSIVTLQYLLNNPPAMPPHADLEIDVASIEAGLPQLKVWFPEISARVDRFEQEMEALRTIWSHDRLTALRDSAQELGSQLEAIEDTFGEHLLQLGQQHAEAHERTFIVWVVSSAIGVVAFGTLVSVFFRRLAADIKLLESRAIAVVGGYSGPPLVVRRRDEVGGLMVAVNRMQSELRHWEQQQEIARQRRIHHEKMAAVGSLAAAVAHEVNNPIAAIAGIGRHLADSRWMPSVDERKREAGLIVKQAERLASITRQLAVLTARRSPEPKLLDMNSLVEATCNFMRYDKRFHRVDLVLELADGLPAVRAVADDLTQVLMNLLINSADATEHVNKRQPTIIVGTAPADKGVLITVRDNGCGMLPNVLAHAFDEFFTTKPIEKGRGIGLSLCKKLLEQNGGSIALESTPGVGTLVQCFVPSSVRVANAA